MIEKENESQTTIDEVRTGLILLIDKTGTTDLVLKQAIANSGFEICECLNDSRRLVEKIKQSNPLLLILNIDQITTKEQSEIAQVNQLSPLPIVIFTKQSNAIKLHSLVKATICDSVDCEIETQQFLKIISLACDRFKKSQLSIHELEKIKVQLITRKLIDRAQGLIMIQKEISEKAAYAMLKRMSVQNNQPLADVARNVISVFSLINPKSK